MGVCSLLSTYETLLGKLQQLLLTAQMFQSGVSAQVAYD